MTRAVCVVTGSRAEYGLLRRLMRGLSDAPDLRLQIIATGMHLAPEFGDTYREIEEDGFAIDARIEMLLSSDTGSGIAKSMGLGMIGFADALRRLAPDLLLVLGDRFEILAAVTAALVMRVPVAHLHGGELTEGAFDDAIRHSITKMSHLHFVATEEYRRRVVQLGEHPDRIFLVGALGVDAIQHQQLLDRAELESSLGFELGSKSLLVTFHPATLGPGTAEAHMSELLAALETLGDTRLVFTMPNADTGGRKLRRMVEDFVEIHPNARAFASLGQLRYLSCMSHVDGVVGNSSSALIEAPTLRKGAVNIGDRQKGRVRGDSVVDCPPERGAIRLAIERLYTPEFRARLAGVVSPYGTGGASAAILEVVRSVPLEGLIDKSFCDLQVADDMSDDRGLA